EKSHPAYTGNHRQHSQRAWKESGTENEVAVQWRRHAKEGQCQRGALIIYFEKQKRHALQLFRTESAQGRRATQHEQRSDIKDASKGLDNATGEFQKRSRERDAAVHRPEQDIPKRRV